MVTILGEFSTTLSTGNRLVIKSKSQIKSNIYSIPFFETCMRIKHFKSKLQYYSDFFQIFESSDSKQQAIGTHIHILEPQ